MCVICASPMGVEQPSTYVLRRMWLANPDGAGYMYVRPDDHFVQIRKGFMSFGELFESIYEEKFTDEDAVVYHFRISTQAGCTPEMTHPFPITRNLSDMKLLEKQTRYGVAHNGIIELTSDASESQYSDTALYISKYMSYRIRMNSDLKDRTVLSQILDETKSKFAILDQGGRVTTIGKFENIDGMLFSNLKFLNRYWYY